MLFPRTSGARNPIVIVRIFIFIFLWLKVVLQAKPCKEGWCNLEGWSRLLQIRHKRLHIFACRGCYNLDQCVFAYNFHTACGTFKKHFVSPDSLTLQLAPPTSARGFFPQNRTNWKTYFFKLLLSILSDLRETWHVHSSIGPDLKLSNSFSELCWVSWYRPRPFPPPFFCEMSKTYFFELLPGDFTNLHKTWHTASVDPSDRRILKEFWLLNNNFLQIMFKTGSVAYLHILHIFTEHCLIIT